MSRVGAGLLLFGALVLRYRRARARLGDSAGSIPATCIAGYLFATDMVHVKQTDLCARANNVSYEAP